MERRPVLKNSKIPYATIEQWVRDNPCRVRADGNIITCPVRLAFPHLSEPQTNNNDDGTTRETYNVAILFPPCAGGMPGTAGQIHDVLYATWLKDCMDTFPDKFVNGVPYGLHSPFHEQAEKASYAGYTPGGVYLNVSSEFKPQVVDSSMNAIPDALICDAQSKKNPEGARCYGGVWAIVSLTHYPFGSKPGARKKGASFGLSSVMIIADDEKLGGGQEDVKSAFAGVKIDRKFDPAGAFGAPVAPPAAAPLIVGSGPVPGAPMAPAPAPVAPSAPPAAPKVWPAAGGGCDPAALAAVGWSAEQMMAAGYQLDDLVAYGVL